MKNMTPNLFPILILAGVMFAGCDKETEMMQEDAEQAEQNTAGEQARVSLDLHPGKALHDANCISCHDASVYTRADRKVGDFPKLLAQVRRCDANLGSRLFDEEIEQVADYLNQAYYQYEK